MNRIKETFKALKENGSKAFIPYITAGDPDIKLTSEIVIALERSGADIIELGIPFSDPLADGPTIQRAIQRSLNKGCTVKKVFDMVRALRDKGVKTPLVFMTYYNIPYNYGIKKFISSVKNCGADGVIIPDLPIEESDLLVEHAKKNDICPIMLTAPTTPAGRFRKIAGVSGGFIYYVSLTGVTGERKTISTDIKSDLKKIKKLTSKPVCAGFGISCSEHAKYIAENADGVIVGSAIIKIIERNMNNKKKIVSQIEKFAGSIARSVHNK